MNARRCYLVTGGGGFLGKALCLRLIQEGHEVKSLARGDYPELQSAGVTVKRADIGSPIGEYADFFRGVDGIFHVAAKVSMWGNYEQFFQSNVTGTRNILALCREHSIQRLVFTSSPSVVADGKNLRGIDESYPYPVHHEAFYPQTKAQAEREVLSANSKNLATIALRPHLIFGPGDRQLIPTVVSRARAGRLVQIGNGKNLSDFTYIDDCVEAHVLAMKALENPVATGRAYFISQGDPMLMWNWINQILVRSNVPPVKRRLPKFIGHSAAFACEAIWRFLPLSSEPPLTQFLVSEMATDHYFSINAAKELLGYMPSVTVQQGIDRTFAV